MTFASCFDICVLSARHCLTQLDFSYRGWLATSDVLGAEAARKSLGELDTIHETLKEQLRSLLCFEKSDFLFCNFFGFETSILV